MIYRVYVTDTLKMINDKLNTRYGGAIFETRYLELVDKKQKKDTRTGEQIAQDVMRFSGLKFEEGGEDNGESSI